MINYVWKLNRVNITYLPQTSEARIDEIHWGCTATDTDTNESVGAVGSIDVIEENYVFPASTVKNATKAQVFQWLNNKLGDEKAAIEANLANQLAANVLNDSFIPAD